MMLIPVFFLPMLLAPFYFVVCPPPAAIILAAVAANQVADEAGERVIEHVTAGVILKKTVDKDDDKGGAK